MLPVKAASPCPPTHPHCHREMLSLLHVRGGKKAPFDCLNLLRLEKTLTLAKSGASQTSRKPPRRWWKHCMNGLPVSGPGRGHRPRSAPIHVPRTPACRWFLSGCPSTTFCRGGGPRGQPCPSLCSQQEDL